MFVDVDEDDRRNEGHQKPADEPAGRYQKVEASQMERGRAETCKRSMAIERGECEDQNVDQTERENSPAGQRMHDRQQDEGGGHETGQQREWHQFAAREGMYERPKIHRERYDPEERDRRYVGGEIPREREEERARNR